MKTYKIDCEESCKMLKQYKSLIFIKDCYANVYRVSTRCLDDDLKIVFGGVSIPNTKRIIAKHCFFMKTDRVIDPTLCLVHNQEEQKELEYYVAQTYSFKDYNKAVIESNGDVSLELKNREYFEKLRVALYEKNIFLVG